MLVNNSYCSCESNFVSCNLKLSQQNEGREIIIYSIDLILLVKYPMQIVHWVILFLVFVSDFFTDAVKLLDHACLVQVMMTLKSVQ